MKLGGNLAATWSRCPTLVDKWHGIFYKLCPVAHADTTGLTYKGIQG